MVSLRGPSHRAGSSEKVWARNSSSRGASNDLVTRMRGWPGSAVISVLAVVVVCSLPGTREFRWLGAADPRDAQDEGISVVRRSWWSVGPQGPGARGPDRGPGGPGSR